ncbi:MAG: 4-hydroxy-tetrahydrodipicolinate reductase [Candidatus Rokuibacteriota bacterium]|nr:MAG: 4-hydroxy-tetrahydrodipicolinate reductase [Candidatus Rokubacteria bacterium]
MTVDAPTAATAHPIPLVVAGAAGRMGNRIVALAPETPGLRVVAALEAPGHATLGRDAGELAGVGRLGVVLGADAAAVLSRDRVLVEFSVPAATLEHLRLVAAAGGRAVVGTTGFSAAERQEIADLGRRAAIMMAPNMSVAVTLAFKLLPLMAKALGDDYDVEITETHHRFKKDAPSGTALRMAEVIAEALGRDLGKVAVYGREGLPGQRTPQEIAVLALRSGDVVGEHTVSFGALGERLELTHRAHTRDTFARGALRAVRWIAARPPGLYDMADVLGLA